MNDDIDIERITLQVERRLATSTLPRETLRSRVHLDELTGQIVLQLEQQLLVDTFAEDSYSTAYQVPASTWSMWLQRHPRVARLLHLQPRLETRRAVVRLARLHAYPFARLPVEQFGRPIVVERIVSSMTGVRDGEQ